MTQPEFDSYSSSYDSGMDGPLKQSIGEDAQTFLRAKIPPLIAAIRALRDPKLSTEQESLKHLDFGCGVGDFIDLLDDSDLKVKSLGYDISPGMIGQGRRRHPNLADRLIIDDRSNKLPPSDIVTAICVFHHIPPIEWLETLIRIRKSLNSNGILAVIEHNPWNPVTSYVVRRTPIDQNAILLPPTKMQELMTKAGFRSVRTRYFLFYPPRFRMLSPIDHLLGRIPLGAQYICAGVSGD